MDRGTAGALVVGLLALVAGCASIGPPTEATESPSATAAGGGMSLTDCPYLLEAEPATGSARDRVDETVPYGDLTDARRSEFRRALNGTAELATLPDRWAGSVLVARDGETYYVVASTC